MFRQFRSRAEPPYRLKAVLILLAPLAGSCAPAFHPPPAPSPEEIPALEAQAASESPDVRALVRLAAAYRQAERATEAADLLERAAGLAPSEPTVALYLGLTYEDLERYDEARSEYERFLELGGPWATERHVRGRLRLLEREELLRAVRTALARESELAATEPQPRTVAVFPFLSAADDPELEPLSRALAELLVRNLSQTDRITVLERLRVQLLLNELQLAEEDVVEAATAARSGRLLGAGNIVQGSILGDEETLRLDAVIVAVGGENAGTVSSVSDEDALSDLFAMQTRVALQIYRSLGVELTVAERERIEQQPTRNIEALLEFGRGLAAEDAGLFAVAADHFAAAAEMDEGFEAARDRASAAAEAAAAAAMSTQDVARAAVEEAAAIAAELDRLTGMVPALRGRDATSEVLGREGLASRGAVIQVIIRRPYLRQW